MQIKATHTFTATLLLAWVSSVFSVGAPIAVNGQYNFDYAVFGEGKSRPIQVFDDGVNTYLQFKAGSDIPAFMSSNGDRKFNYELDGPYAVIRGTPHDIVAQFGQSRSRIVHSSLTSNAVQYSKNGQSAPVKSMQSFSSNYEKAMIARNGVSDKAVAQVGHVVPANSWQDNSYAIPKKGDHVEWVVVDSGNQSVQRILFAKGDTKLTKEGAQAVANLAKSLNRASDVSVVGSDDDSYKEDLGETRARILKDTLIRYGVPKELITVKTSTPSESDQIIRGKKVFTPSFIKWHLLPQQATSVQAEIGRQLATGSISIAQASLRLQQISQSSKSSTFEQEPIEAAQLLKKFSINLSDGTVDGLLRRWGTEFGWRVISKDAPEIKINGDAELMKHDFLKAADVVISQARQAGYRIKATAYSNNVLVISEDEK